MEKDTFAAVFCEAHKKGERTMANGFTRPIPVAKLRQHPKNVRKTYDDIEELTASVRENGVLQNLTVVKDPADEGYYLVIIGNRRLMAARAAGLDYLHCNVVEMSEAEQMATMLCENMQRKDLTVIEEANGVQMCLDLGISEKDLQKKTGLSRETIRTRKKIASLELTEEYQNATVQDYLKVAELKDEANREKALEKIGTDGFNWKVNELKQEEERQELYNKLAPLLNFHAKEVESVSYSEIDKQWELESVEDLEKIEWEDDARYVYRLPGWGKTVQVYKLKGEEEEEDQEVDDYTASREAKRNAVEEGRKKAEIARVSRLEYIKKAYGHEPVDKKKLIKWLAKLKFMWDDPDFDLYAEIMGDEREDYDDELSEDDILQAINNDADVALVLVYATLETMPGSILPTMTGYGTYIKNENYQLLYDFMIDFGYKPSKEERKLLDGTHEIYLEEE